MVTYLGMLSHAMSSIFVVIGIDIGFSIASINL